jgi:hypothetical protein
LRQWDSNPIEREKRKIQGQLHRSHKWGKVPKNDEVCFTKITDSVRLSD